MKHLLLSLILNCCATAAGAQAAKDISGCWTMSGLKAEYLSLDTEGNFYFNHYREISRSFEPFFGTWKLKGAQLVLSYGDRQQMRFKVVRADDDRAWMLYQPGRVQLFKAPAGDCGGQ